MPPKPNSYSSENRIFDKLINAPLFATYRKAFMDATGMGLQLIPFDHEAPVSSPEFRSPFCVILNKQAMGCRSCNQACENLYRSADTSAKTIACFANLRETAIPVRAGGLTVALLTTGQVFTKTPSEKGFASVETSLKENGATNAKVAKLKEAWFNTQSLPV